jgi:hypothetical protein
VLRRDVRVGYKNSGPRNRTACPPAARANDDAGERLLKAITTLREDGAVAAYRRLQKGGDVHLTGLGPASFAKVLCTAIASHPLILDRFIARALNEQAILGWRTNWNWSPDQYAHHLGTATSWASELFNHGKALI